MKGTNTRSCRSRGLAGLMAAMALFIFSAAAYGETFWTTLGGESRGKEVPITNETFSKLSEKLRPAVVNISTTMMVRGQPSLKGRPSPFGEQDPFREFWEKFFGGQLPQEYETKSLGSGVIINKQGYIVTNNHVVENAKEITVTLYGEKDYPAEVVGRDKKIDLALIKIDAKEDLPLAPLGDSDKLKVGEWVLAIGNPFGLAETVTAGICSAKGRVIGAGPYDDFIQTDASINPGNSGGPLFNFWGEVVGINTAIVAAGQGIGFAIPINMAKEILPQLKEKGRVTRGWLGVTVQRITSQLAKSFGLKEESGALVSQVVKGSPAERSGIKSGDVILEFNGKKIKEFGELSRVVASTPVGTVVPLKVFREGKTITLEATIAQLEERAEMGEAPVRKTLGFTVQNLTPEIARALGLGSDTTGVVVAQVEKGSPADAAGITRGDIIQEVDHQPIEDADDFYRAIEKGKGQESILLLIRRGDTSLYIALAPK